MRCTRGLMVTEAMRAVGFTSDDADNQCKRMWIHRRVKKNDDNTPTSVSIQLDGDVLFVSLLGDSLSNFLGSILLRRLSIARVKMQPFSDRAGNTIIQLLVLRILKNYLGMWLLTM